MENNNSKKGFQYLIINLVAFLSMFAVHLVVHGQSELYMTIFGYLGFIIIVIAMIGSYYSLKGIREQNSAKKIIAISLNGIFVLAFILMLIMSFIK